MSFSSYFDYPGVATEEQHDDLVFLPGLSEADWERLLAHADLCRFAAGDTVIRAGDRDRALYIVAEGTLEAAAAGQRTAIAAGSVVGDTVFFDDRPHDETVTAISDSELLRLSFEQFEAMAAREPALARAVLLDLGRILTVRLRRATTRSAS